MSQLRLFIALPLPKEVKELLEQQQAALLRALPYKIVRWSNPEILHLTLLFLGYIEEHKVELVKQSLDFGCRQHRKFNLKTAEPSAFPSLQRPSILYTAVAGDTSALTALVVSISEQLLGLYEPDKRRFKPHLTLGKVSKPEEVERVTQALMGIPPFYPATWTVDEVVLYSSKLSPSGAKHDPLYRLALSD